MPHVNPKSNSLIHEKSPYLLQHAHNPVDWYPWGEEAFEKARRDGKPVFLSIGYSTCHWCHVMEKESFEDNEVAEILNEHFVSIKVDREERPDIDHIYMSVCQAMTGQGGWPLTIIMNPDKEPFFAGTYFPKTSKWGRPGLVELLLQIAELWRTKPDELEKISKEVVRRLNESIEIHTHVGEVSADLLHVAYGQLYGNYDERYGGFGGAPKFPTPHNLLFLTRYFDAFGEERALEMVEKTLTSMYRGGIYDHLGFGFARYSTDDRWLVPHFEKMLYDNALLAYTYLEAYQATRKPFYKRVAREVFDYVLRDMTSPEGAFYSAEDADSEGVEGKFYVWSPGEITEVLGRELGEKICRFYNVTEDGNFEGKNILNLIQDGGSDERDSVGHNSVNHALEVGKRSIEIENARWRLFEARENRIHPHKDDKILTGWNGLMIAALAKGAQVLGDHTLAIKAEKAVHFIQRHLVRGDGRLLARYRDGESEYLAYAEDYAFLIWGLIELYQAGWNVEYLGRALELQRDMTDLFWDNDNGGFYFYGEDGEKLLVRNKEIYDGATPSANSVASLNALRLARLTGEGYLEEQADALLRTFSGVVKEHPGSFTFFLLAVDFALGNSQEIVVALRGDDTLAQGDTAAIDAVPSGEIMDVLREVYLPRSVVMGYRSPKEYKKLKEISPAVEGKYVESGKSMVYICRDFRCRAPVSDPEKLKKTLTETRGR